MRKNIRRGIIALAISATSLSAYAQPAIPRKYIEHPGFSLGLQFGFTDLWGDIGTKSIIDHYTNGKYQDKPCFMGGIFGRVTAHPMLAFRLNASYGTLFATDEWNEDKARSAKSIEEDAFQRYLRNQDVRVNIWEGSLVAEFMPLRINSESKGAAKKMQPYVVAGIGGFHFRPQSSYINPVTGHKKWIDVHDLAVEGEGLEYEKATATYARVTKLWQICVPVGLGLRWDLNPELAFGVEYQFRFTTTDRLDNVSDEYVSDDYHIKFFDDDKAALARAMSDKSWAIEPSVDHADWTKRGNKAKLDGYSSVSVMLIYKINSNTIPWWF